MKLHRLMSSLLVLGAPFLAQCSPTPALDEGRAAIVGEIVAEVDHTNLMLTVEEFVDAHDTDTPLDCIAAGFPSGHSLCYLTRDSARELMRQKFQLLGLTVNFDTVSDGLYSTVNLVAEKKGTKRPEEIVLVGAHYDAFYSGADDNSSGVAAVLEIARVLQSREFPRTVRFVGFDLEELGLVGSTRYTTTTASADNIVGAIIFDCIGFRSFEPNSQDSLPGFPAPSVGNFVAVIGNATSTKLSDDAWLMQQRLGVVEVVGVDSPGLSDSLATGNLLRSDHAPFWLQDKPALFITDTANFRNPHYHMPTDQVSTLDPGFLKAVTQLSAALIAYWAGG
jgi:Zn-dependent M28 family amino/carboxypeptidase